MVMMSSKRAVSHAVSASGRPGGELDRGAGRSGCRATCGFRQLCPRSRRVASRSGAECRRARPAWVVLRERLGSSRVHARVVARDGSQAGCGVPNARHLERGVPKSLHSEHVTARIPRRARRGFLRVVATRRIPAAARCGAPPLPLSTRPRLCDQLQHLGTLRGADVITDHGAVHVVIVQRIPASILMRLVLSFFSSIHTFLCFLGSHSSAAREKKGKKC